MNEELQAAQDELEETKEKLQEVEDELHMFSESFQDKTFNAEITEKLTADFQAQLSEKDTKLQEVENEMMLKGMDIVRLEAEIMHMKDQREQEVKKISKTKEKVQEQLHEIEKIKVQNQDIV